MNKKFLKNLMEAAIDSCKKIGYGSCISEIKDADLEITAEWQRVGGTDTSCIMVSILIDEVLKKSFLLPGSAKKIFSK